MKVSYSLRGNNIHGTITWESKRFRFAVGKAIDPKKWDSGKVSSRYKESTHINGILDSQRKVIETAYYSQKNSGKDVTNEYFEHLLKHTETKSLYQALDEMINDEPKRRGWAKDTHKRFIILRNILMSLDYPVNFDTINTHFNKIFTDKLLEKKLQNSTINDIFKKLRWFMRWSYNQGYHQNKYFETREPRMKTAKSKPIALSIPELKQIINLKLSGIDDLIRDAFLFTCYTGMRVSDLYVFKKSYIYGDFIRFTPIKKPEELTIPIGSALRIIINKRIDTPGDNLFLLPSQQEYRILIKHICFLAGIKEKITQIKFTGGERTEETHSKWELVSTHTGRKTFVSILVNQGVSESVISTMTGHSLMIMRDHYESISSEAKQKAVSGF